MRSKTETFIINPYIAGSPIKNPTMFFGRDDVYAWLRQHLRGRYQDNIIVLYGERRSGKTSVLYQMGEQLGDKTYIPILIDFQGMGLEGLDGFLWELARKIVTALRGVEGMSHLDRPNRRDYEENPRHQFEEVFLPPILAALGEHHLLLMFDESDRLEEKIEAGDLPPAAINYLRSLLQHSNQLNFIFSVGNRVEEARHLSQLFNLAVYRKISFLEQDFAEDLITKPVAQHYTYTRPAIERIFELTSGQPYYTQLLCHNIFTYWTERRQKQIDVADVEAVLPEIIEQATPNLQFAWDDSAPVEKAILATLAFKLPQYRAGVMRRSLDRTIRQAHFYPPHRDVTTGLKRLFERDIINRQEPYQFRVGFLRLWLTEYKRLDWIQEELKEAAEQWRASEEKRLAEAPTPVEQARRWAPAVLAGTFIGGLLVLVIFWFAIPPPPNTGGEVNTLSTQVAALQTTATAVQVKVLIADTEGNTEEAGIIRETATANAIEVATAQARATQAGQSEATTIAAQINAAHTQVAIAQGTAAALEVALANIVETPTDTPTQTPTSTASPPPTATPSPTVTPTPRPTATAVPRLQGRLAIPVANGSGRYDLRIYSVSTGAVLAEIANASQPRFNEAGDQLAVKAQRGDSDTIWIYDADGQNPRQASSGQGNSHPAWNLGGEQLVYENRNVLKDGQSVWRIFVQEEIVSPTANDIDIVAGDIFDADRPLYPLWTATGDIVFSACNYWSNGGQCGIWRTSALATVPDNDNDPDKGFLQPESITRDREIPTDIEGNRLLVMGEIDRNWEVYVGSMAGGALQNLSNNPASDGLGVFSPDGRWIAFVSHRDDKWGIWVIPSTGGQATRLPLEELQFAAGERNWTTERIAWGP